MDIGKDQFGLGLAVSDKKQKQNTKMPKCLKQGMIVFLMHLTEVWRSGM